MLKMFIYVYDEASSVDDVSCESRKAHWSAVAKVY